MVGQLSVVFGVHSTPQTPRGYGWVLHLGVISPPQSFASAGGGQLGRESGQPCSCGIWVLAGGGGLRVLVVGFGCRLPSPQRFLPLHSHLKPPP